MISPEHKRRLIVLTFLSVVLGLTNVWLFAIFYPELAVFINLGAAIYCGYSAGKTLAFLFD